jgi:hypothetical protein
MKVQATRKLSHFLFGQVFTTRGKPHSQSTCNPALNMGMERGEDLNLQPSGYEPDELPLLYPAMLPIFRLGATTSYSDQRV